MATNTPHTNLARYNKLVQYLFYSWQGTTGTQKITTAGFLIRLISILSTTGTGLMVMHRILQTRPQLNKGTGIAYSDLHLF